MLPNARRRVFAVGSFAVRGALAHLPDGQPAGCAPGARRLARIVNETGHQTVGVVPLS